MKHETMKQEHINFVAKLSKDLAKKNMTFDGFLRSVRLTSAIEDEKPKLPSSLGTNNDNDNAVVTNLRSVDVVFGRGK